MHEISPFLAARWPRVASGEADWLVELAGDFVTGMMAPPMPDAVWVLNAMDENEALPGDVSHDEDLRAANVGVALPRGVATGGGLGRADHPGDGWRRLRWAELARRSGDEVVREDYLPCLHCFPLAMKNGSWPLSIRPPTEGSLDRPTYDRLIEVLIEQSPQGADTRCVAYYNPLMFASVDVDNLHLRMGRLGDAKALYDNPEVEYGPSNLWAADRSWVTYTDYDLWGTKVCGPASLVEALLDDREIEAFRLPERR
ncbi:hypothetical protein ABT160_45455 [Streptomyces sp. NPDC001941]|uniref:hypothetical protein n=1 Tax=Streptomyces sp. NPDC001941 TaxID=3154659 RepID=UPI00331C54F1